MRFKKTRDILDDVGRFHDEVSVYCQHLSDRTAQKRLGMLLDYIRDRESGLASAVSQFTDHAPEALLETWYQYTGEEAPIRRELATELREEMSLGDLLRLVMRIDDHFLDLYGHLVDAAETDDQRQTFQNLLDREQKEKEKLARNFQLFLDL